MKLKLLLFILIISLVSCSLLKNRPSQKLKLLNKNNFKGYVLLTVLKETDTILIITPKNEIKTCKWREILKPDDPNLNVKASKIVGNDGSTYYFYYTSQDLNKEYKITESSAPIGTDKEFLIYSYASKPYYL